MDRLPSRGWLLVEVARKQDHQASKWRLAAHQGLQPLVNGSRFPRPGGSARAVLSLWYTQAPRAGSATLFTVEAKSVDVEAVKRDVRFSTLSNHRRI